MRIACIYLPSLPLQVFLRGAPQAIGAPVVVVGVARTVIACSRAAWNGGIRPGMSALAALELVPGLNVHIASAGGEHERAAVRGLADALLAMAGPVDISGEPTGVHHAIYVGVPAKTRGASFGVKLLAAVEAQGLRARVGIADDRFTAWVAATTATSSTTAGRQSGGAKVVSVPRGGSAAFLSPLPLSLLAITPEVQHVLAVVGVRTLGEFAALPPPSVTHPWDADYQALARGDGGAGLVAYAPSGVIVERVAVAGEIGVGAALGLVAKRIAGRLVGRDRAAARLLVRTGDREIDVTLPAPTADERDLSDVVGRALHESGAAAFVEIEVAVDVTDVITNDCRTAIEGDGRTAIEGDGRTAIEGDCRTAIEGDGRPAIEDDCRTAIEGPIAVEAPPAAVVAEGSAAVETPVFRLTPPAAMGMGPREAHRRTRRGKQRSRVTASAQSRLFAR